MNRRPARRAVAAAALLALALTACGSSEDAQLAGSVLEPLPVVAGISLPDATNDLQPFELTAPPGGLLVVYFGYTNCPDYCPTTMSDVKLARSRLDEPERISVAMVTVDPERDFIEKPELCEGIVLGCYVRSFVDDGHALGTDDADDLAAAATAFGVSYNVLKNGDEVVVEHSTRLYAVDDQGRMVVTWPFGVTVDDLASDMQILLEQAGAA